MSQAGSSLEPARHAAVADLVDALRQLEGLTGQLGPFALPADTLAQAPELVTAVSAVLGIPVTVDPAADTGKRDYAAQALAEEVRRSQAAPELAGLAVDDVALLAAEARRLYDAEEGRLRRHRVHRPDGTVVDVVEAGPPDAPAVVLSPACAMSHRLSLPWLRSLGSRFRCLVPDTRGTSGRIERPEAFDERGYGVDEQAGDLLAVIDTLATGPVHLMGLCGGAVPALLVAARHPDRLHSASLWHADLELGDEADKTEHQVNLRAVLDLAGESRETAAWLRERLVSGPMTGVPAGVGPLVVRPYASAELFYRYAKLTAATMHWDSRGVAADVPHPCLVVTSQDDHTAHPEGSRRLAGILPDARLVVTDHGTHLDAFRSTPEQVSHLTTFLDRLVPPALRDIRPGPAEP